MLQPHRDDQREAKVSEEMLKENENQAGVCESLKRTDLLPLLSHISLHNKLTYVCRTLFLLLISHDFQN